MVRRLAVYIDGFNYYYGVYKDQARPFSLGKWMDPSKLCEAIAAGTKWPGKYELGRYFTAPPHDPPHDPTRSTRQRAYLEALVTLPNFTVHESFHKTVTKRGVLVGDTSGKVVDFHTREEKGSDVSLGAYLVRDAALKLMNVAIVISNDSDLKDAVRIARTDFGVTVVVVNPSQSSYNSVDLRKASNKRNIRLDRNLILQCSLPNPVVASDGAIISKPATW